MQTTRPGLQNRCHSPISPNTFDTCRPAASHSAKLGSQMHFTDHTLTDISHMTFARQQRWPPDLPQYPPPPENSSSNCSLARRLTLDRGRIGMQDAQTGVLSQDCRYPPSWVMEPFADVSFNIVTRALCAATWFVSRAASTTYPATYLSPLHAAPRRTLLLFGHAHSPPKGPLTLEIACAY